MKRLIALAVVVLFVTSCATQGDQARTEGTLIGAGLGAAIGAGMGYAIGRSGTSAGIGAAIGGTGRRGGRICLCGQNRETARRISRKRK